MNNIKLTNPKKFPSTDQRIVRQSCLKCAVEQLKRNTMADGRSVTVLAEYFFDWVYSELK